MEDVQLTLIESNDDVQRFFRWLGERRTWLGIDTETSGLDWWRDVLRTVQIGDTRHGWVFSWNDYAGAVKEALRAYQSGPMVFHNAKFDLHFLENNGVTLDRSLIHDTHPMAHLVEPHLSSRLKDASSRHVSKAAKRGEYELKVAFSKGGWDWGTVPIDLPAYWVYAALDPVITARLAETLWPTIYNSYKKIYDVEVQVAMTLQEMEQRGMRIDTRFCHQQIFQLNQYEKSMEQWFYDTWGIENPGSTQQIAEALEAHGAKLTNKTKTGKWKMDEDTLKTIDHPIAREVLNYRDSVKTRGTYYQNFIDFADPDGYLHCSINPLGARTGRMSASRPPLQQIPRSKVRSAFTARDGNKLLLADFDQIEYRLMTAYSQEPLLLKAIADGEDLHTYVARLVYDKPNITKEERQVAKNANFAKIYGAGVVKFAATAGITIQEAARFMKLYDSRFTAVGRFIKDVITYTRNNGGRLVTPYLGRLQVVGDVDKAYKMTNYYIQGTAADVLKQKMVELSMSDSSQFMVMPIHDEIAFDVPKEYAEDVEREVTAIMQEPDAFAVPLTVSSEIVDRWGDKYD